MPRAGALEGGAANRSWQVRNAPWYHLRMYLRSLWPGLSRHVPEPVVGYELTCAATALEKVVSRA